eukprot:2950612-Ditylum_brightwellii.AAC.3
MGDMGNNKGRTRPSYASDRSITATLHDQPIVAYRYSKVSMDTHSRHPNRAYHKKDATLMTHRHNVTALSI